MRRGVSPYASGGGGVTLERRVAAGYLARLLTGTTAPELGGRRVTRVAFQRGPERAVDDLLVTAAREDGADPLELAIAVRRAPLFQASDQHTEKLIRCFLVDLLADTPDRREGNRLPGDPERRLAVCVGGPLPAAKQVAVLAAHARAQASAEGFFRLLRTPESFDRAIVERLAQLVALVAAGLKTLGEDASPAAVEAVTWSLLTRLDVLMPRVEPQDETDWSGPLLDQLKPWAREPTTGAAISLRDRLESLAATYGPVAADVDRTLLCRDAREAIRTQAAGNARALKTSPSPYMEQVRQIAPDLLRDRETELADLARLCTEPDRDQTSYSWWRADAWSGKSALLSWFALNPPPRTRVVAFFVTARWGAQNDAAAFTDAVSQQLAHLLGEQLPASLTDTTRYAHLLRLLRDAAQLCQDNGERLVLVLDGLDEDRGVDGPNGHSIAGLLPASPPSGCRVVVASRPNPPVPADVPDNHPLRDPRILRPLPASPHAGGVRSAMERELHHLLEGTPFEQDLLGLLLAAGGGLGARELAELTGKTAYEVTWRLKTSAARSFTTRPARWQPEAAPVYILGHEELRVSAAEALGPRRIAEFRARVHQWADGYRGDQWPADTPEYLLDGYHRMLASVGDFGRAADYATDRPRHERMRNLTGGDGAALKEISALLDALKPRADLHAMTRLALHRDTLSDRNRLIPVTLPALWAKLGQLSRAEAMASSLPRVHDRATALVHVAEALATAGHRDRAVAVALDAVALVDAISHDRSHVVGTSLPVSLPAGLARILREAGVEGKASSVLEAAETVAAMGGADEADRARSLVKVAQELRENGDHDRALAVLGRAESFAWSAGGRWDRRGSALATVAPALEAAGQHERALTAASGAADAIESIPEDWPETASESTYVSVVSAAAAALVDLGDQDRALAILHRAERTVRALVTKGRFNDVWAVALLALAMKRRGDAHRALALLDYAETLADVVVERDERLRAMVDLARVLADSGDLDRALGLFFRAEALATEGAPAGWGEAAGWAEATLIVIARGLRQSGDRPAAVAVLERAETIVRSVPDSSRRRASRLTDIAHVWEELGDPDRAASVAGEAENLAETSSDIHRLAWMLAEVGQALARTGTRQQASALANQVEAIAHTVPHQDKRDSLFGLAARMFTVAGDHGHAQAVTNLIADPDDLIHTLAKMADVIESSGEHDRASFLGRRAEALLALDRARSLDQSTQTSVVRVLGAIGDFDQAQAVAASIIDPGEQALALGTLAQSLITANELSRAALLISLIPQPEDSWFEAVSDNDWMRIGRAQKRSIAKINALSDLARAWVAGGDRKKALAAASSAEEIADGAPIRAATRGFARALAALGDQVRAETLVHTVADTDDKAQILLAIAKETSPEDARRLIAEALVLGRWTKSLDVLAEIEPQTVIAVSEEFLALVAPALRGRPEDHPRESGLSANLSRSR